MNGNRRTNKDNFLDIVAENVGQFFIGKVDISIGCLLLSINNGQRLSLFPSLFVYISVRLFDDFV